MFEDIFAVPETASKQLDDLFAMKPPRPEQAAELVSSVPPQQTFPMPRQEALMGKLPEPEQLRQDMAQPSPWREGFLGYIASSAQSLGSGMLKGGAQLLKDMGIWDNELNTAFQQELGKNIQEHQMQQQKNIENAMLDNGVLGRGLTIAGQTAADTILFLGFMAGAFKFKALGAIGKMGSGATRGQAIWSNVVANSAQAAKLAAYRFVATPAEGATEEERMLNRAKAAGMAFAYRATPALSGLSGSDLKAVIWDLALNSGISIASGQYTQAWEQGKQEAEAAGDKNWLAYSLTNLIPITGTDVAFSLGTRGIATQMARANGAVGDIPGRASGGVAQNIARKFFDDRKDANKPVPEGYDTMPFDRLMQEYLKFNRGTPEKPSVLEQERQVEVKAQEAAAAQRKAESERMAAEREAGLQEIRQQSSAATTQTQRDALGLRYAQLEGGPDAKVEDYFKKGVTAKALQNLFEMTPEERAEAYEAGVTRLFSDVQAKMDQARADLEARFGPETVAEMRTLNDDLWKTVEAGLAEEGYSKAVINDIQSKVFPPAVEEVAGVPQKTPQERLNDAASEAFARVQMQKRTKGYVSEDDMLVGQRPEPAQAPDIFGAPEAAPMPPRGTWTYDEQGRPVQGGEQAGPQVLAPPRQAGAGVQDLAARAAPAAGRVDAVLPGERAAMLRSGSSLADLGVSVPDIRVGGESARATIDSLRRSDGRASGLTQEQRADLANRVDAALARSGQDPIPTPEQRVGGLISERKKAIRAGGTKLTKAVDAIVSAREIPDDQRADLQQRIGFELRKAKNPAQRVAAVEKAYQEWTEANARERAGKQAFAEWQDVFQITAPSKTWGGETPLLEGPDKAADPYDIFAPPARPPEAPVRADLPEDGSRVGVEAERPAEDLFADANKMVPDQVPDATKLIPEAPAERPPVAATERPVDEPQQDLKLTDEPQQPLTSVVREVERAGRTFKDGQEVQVRHNKELVKGKVVVPEKGRPYIQLEDGKKLDSRAFAGAILEGDAQKIMAAADTDAVKYFEDNPNATVGDLAKVVNEALARDGLPPLAMRDMPGILRAGGFNIQRQKGAMAGWKVAGRGSVQPRTQAEELDLAAQGIQKEAESGIRAWQPGAGFPPPLKITVDGRALTTAKAVDSGNVKSEDVLKMLSGEKTDLDITFGSGTDARSLDSMLKGRPGERKQAQNMLAALWGALNAKENGGSAEDIRAAYQSASRLGDSPKAILDSANAMTTEAGGKFSKGTGDVIGTARLPGDVKVTFKYGDMGAIPSGERAGEKIAGQLTGAGKDFTVTIDRKSGMISTPRHELTELVGVMAKSRLSGAYKGQMNRALEGVLGKGFNVDRSEDWHRLAERLETAEGRGQIAEALSKASPSAQRGFRGWVNGIIQAMNRLFGTNIKELADKDWAKFSESFKDLGVFKVMSEMDPSRGVEWQQRQQDAPLRGDSGSDPAKGTEEARFQSAPESRNEEASKLYPETWKEAAKDARVYQEMLAWRKTPEGQAAKPKQLTVAGQQKWYQAFRDEQVKAPAGDPQVVGKITQTVGKWAKTKLDAAGNQIRQTKASRIIKDAIANTTRPVFMAEQLGVRDELLDVARGATDESGRVMASYKDMMQTPERSQRMGRIIKSGPVKLAARLGGTFTPVEGEATGGRETTLEMDPRVAVTYYMYLKRAEAVANTEGRSGARLDNAVSRFVIERSSDGDEKKVFHVSKAERERFIQQMEKNADVRAETEAMNKAMDMIYEAVSAQHERIHGSPLQKDDFYFHMIRDPAWIKRNAQGKVDAKTAEDVFKLFEHGKTFMALNPESASMLQQVQWSDAPLILRRADDMSVTSLSDAARYLEASPQKDWIEKNILNPVSKAAMSESETGVRQIEYWNKMADTIGGMVDLERSPFAKAVSAFIKSATPVRLMNPYVWAKQPMSMPASIAYFDNNMKYLGAMYGRRDKSFIDQVMKASGTLQGRYASRQFDVFLPDHRGQGAGASDTGIYDSKMQALRGKSTKFTQSMMQKTDRIAINGIIMAARQYALDKNPGLTGEALVRETAKHAANAVKMTQVATYSSDRTLMETNVDSPWERMVLTYMWGARGAQYNLMMNALRKAWDGKDASSLKTAAVTLAMAGLAQSAGVTMVDTMRDKIRSGGEPSDEDVNQLLKFSVGMAESIFGTVPMATEFSSTLFGPLYRAIGATDTAQKRTFRAGQTGPLSAPVGNIAAIFSAAERLYKSGDQMAKAKTPSQKRAMKQREKDAIKRAIKAAVRLSSETTGIPVSQLMQVYTDIVGD